MSGLGGLRVLFANHKVCTPLNPALLKVALPIVRTIPSLQQHIRPVLNVLWPGEFFGEWLMPPTLGMKIMPKLNWRRFMVD